METAGHLRDLQFFFLIREDYKAKPFSDVITKAADFLLSHLKTLTVGPARV